MEITAAVTTTAATTAAAVIAAGTAAAKTAAAVTTATNRHEPFRPKVLFTSLVPESESVKQQHEDGHEEGATETGICSAIAWARPTACTNPATDVEAAPMAALTTTAATTTESNFQIDIDNCDNDAVVWR